MNGREPVLAGSKNDNPRPDDSSSFGPWCPLDGTRRRMFVLLYFGDHTCLPVDTAAGHVQVFVGFGSSTEEAEKNALGSCSHIQLDLQTCLDSDRILGRNTPPDKDGSPLHLKYMKAVKRITACE